jgi:transposase
MNDLDRFLSEVLEITDPWKIENVERVIGPLNVWETHICIAIPPRTMLQCPECGSVCKVHDRKERIWRHLDLCGDRTFIHAAIPRTDCPRCGVRQVQIPWAREGSRFSVKFEEMLLSMVSELPVATLARMVGETPNRVWRIVEHYADTAVNGSDLSCVKRVGVDEKSFSGREYVTVFVDIDKGNVIFMTPKADKDAIRRFSMFLKEHKGSPRNVTDFTCDFSSAYISGIRKYFKKARITGDRFHLVRMANDALEKTKCRELVLSINRMRAKYLLLRSSKNLHQNEIEMRDKICKDNEKLGTAYRMKESLCSVYFFDNVEDAKDHLRSWAGWAGSSGLYHFVKLAGTVKKHAAHILAWFVTRLSNAVLEGTNSLISLIKHRARGYHKVESLMAITMLTVTGSKCDMYGRGM